MKKREERADGVKISRRVRVGANDPRAPVFLSDDDRRKAFKGDCPSCSAPMIAMSEVAKSQPTSWVSKGDVIKCDHCGHNALVQAVNPGNKLQLCKLPIPTLLD